MEMVKINGMDFLVMAQNGVLKVNVGENGTITGLDLPDEMVEQYDGLMVAINEFAMLLSNTKFSLMKKSPKSAENIIEKNKNIEE